MIRILLVMFLAALATPASAAMTLTSTDFAEGSVIPDAQIYPRCGGKNISPELKWTGAPASTRSFVLTMIDESVKPSQWSHWVVVNIPATTTELARGGALPDGAKAIASNFGDAFYDGPCPPTATGKHVYVLTIWAMPDVRTNVIPNAIAKNLPGYLGTMALDHASLSGTVTR